MADQSLIDSAARAIANIPNTLPTPFAVAHLLNARSFPPTVATSKDSNTEEGVLYLVFRCLTVFAGSFGLHVVPTEVQVSDHTLFGFYSSPV